jgi:threonine dehydratase
MTDESPSGPAIELADVEAAAERIRPHIHRTPLITSTRVDERMGAHIICKAESLQRTGSFKFRGATNAIASLSPEERARGIITYSSGNHGQAISRAAGAHGCAATVVMPTDAPSMKRAATEHWGAKVVEYERYTQDRAEVASELQANTGGVIIPPYDNRQVMAGQGTVALELFDDVPDLDVLVVCLGGGGLLAGCSTVAKAHNPDVIVVGVEPEAGDDHLQSRRAGRRISLPSVPQTIADGQQTTEPGVLTWSVNNVRVDEFVTVSDTEIIDTMRLLFEQHKLVVEPSGATALAAVLHGGFIERDMRVGVTISGGNIDLPSFQEMMV